MRRTCYSHILSVSLACCAVASAQTVGTAFTYQGELVSDGTPVTTPCDFVFTLHDAESGGNQIGGPLNRDAIALLNGVFSVVLDFGEEVFDGNARWLGITVLCPSGSLGPSLELHPRQEIRPVPYALALPAMRVVQVGRDLGGTCPLITVHHGPTLIGGWHGNFVTEDVQGATISGGGGLRCDSSGITPQPNAITASFGTIGGGMNNTAAGDHSTIAGGRDNLTEKAFATVSGGSRNSATYYNATIGGGVLNTASGDGATIGGGVSNTVVGQRATVCGGNRNNATGGVAAIGGGAENTSAGDAATIGGGVCNDALGGNSAVGGGRNNLAGGGSATVSGGERNRALGASSTIAGGNNNEATGTLSTIGGGEQNLAASARAVVCGGETNRALRSFSFVGGGINNEVDGEHAVVVGGRENSASSSDASVGGGFDNRASGDGSTVAGGAHNWSFGTFAFVGGGERNNAGSLHATIGGGEENVANNNAATVGGGRFNRAGGRGSTVGGGLFNEANGESSTACGGDNNFSLSAYASVGGGRNNEVRGWYGTVPGGANNNAGGDYSFAAGRRAKIRGAGELSAGMSGDSDGDEGTFIWADSRDADFVSGGPNQFRVRATGGTFFVSAVDAVGEPTTGVELTSGTSAWAPHSDRASKKNIEPVDARHVLNQLVTLPIATWKWKAEGGSVRHMGPMAQDFHAAFGLGADEKRIVTVDADGVALAAIQGLHQLVKEKDAQIANLTARLERMEAMVAKLAASSEVGQ